MITRYTWTCSKCKYNWTMIGDIKETRELQGRVKAGIEPCKHCIALEKMKGEQNEESITKRTV